MHQLERWFGAGAGRHEDSYPWVTLTYAQSLDGSITSARGQPLGLSGPESMKMTHHLRSNHDAILVGIGTVLADNPRLTARGVGKEQPQPVVLDSKLRFPLTSKLFEHTKKPWIATSIEAPAALKKRLKDLQADVIEFGLDSNGYVPLDDLLKELWNRGIRSLMVEGGSRVITQFLVHKFVDGVVITIAPTFVGGLSVIEKRMSREIKDVFVEKAGEDIVIWGRLK